MDDVSPARGKEPGRKRYLRWPARTLGPAPGLRELTMASWGWLAGVLITQYCLPLLSRFKTGKGFVHVVPSDFVYFYGIGSIANGNPLAKLYDFNLQLKTFNAISAFPLHGGAYGPSPYPPFVALFFSLFARFPIVPAFFVWASVSLALYLAGIAAAIQSILPAQRLKSSLIFPLALSFFPFLQDTLANGQIATIAVFSVGLAVFEERRSRLLSSGLALSILTYKPTLLFLLIPMLLLTRRFRTLCGFLGGAALLAAVATVFGGIEIWPAYARFLAFFGRFVGVKGRSILFLSQYLDIKSFIQALCGGWSILQTVCFIPIVVLVATAMAFVLWKSAKGSRALQMLAWATTLTWTLLLNVYVPVYDSVLMTIAAVLTVGALKELEWETATGWMTFLAVLISVASWELESIAQSHGIQFLPILLAAFGISQLYLLHRAAYWGLPRGTLNRCLPI